MIWQKHPIWSIATLLSTMFYTVYALSNIPSICNEPAEEGKSTIIVLALKAKQMQSCDIIVTNSLHGPVARCSAIGNCSIAHPSLYDARLNILPGQCFIEVTVFNISRAGLRPDQTLYFSARSKSEAEFDNYVCSPKIFLKAESIHCSYVNVRDGLEMTCSTPRVFPSGQCHVSANFTLMSDVTIRTSASQLKETIPYFSFSCALFINATNMRLGSHAIKATIYPNVTGQVSDTDTYGTSTSKTLYLEMPVVSVAGCPKSVEEGKKVNCRCERGDKSVVNVSLGWYDPDSDERVADESFEFMAHRNHPVYYCQSINNIGWRSKRVYYRPLIFAQNVTSNNASTIVFAITTSVAILLSLVSISLWCNKRKCRIGVFDVRNDFSCYQPANVIMKPREEIQLEQENIYSPAYQTTNIAVNRHVNDTHVGTKKDELHYGYMPCISILSGPAASQKPVHYDRQTHQYETL